MTTHDDTTKSADDMLRGKNAQWLKQGRDGLAAIRRAERGEPGDGTIAHVQQYDDELVVLTNDGRIRVILDGDLSAGLQTEEAIEAADVARFFRFFFPIAFAQISEIAKALKEKEAKTAPEEAAAAAKKRRRDAYIDRVLTNSGPPAGSRREFTLFVAPNCEGDILTLPPRIVRDPEGVQRVETGNGEDWHEQGVVEEVTRLERYGLVLVATDEAAYLMTAEDFDHPIE
jgi:hypothetical protein